MPAPTRTGPFTKEAWNKYVEAPKTPAPKATAADCVRLSPKELKAVLTSWSEHHGRLGPYELDEATKIADEILVLCQANDELAEHKVRRGAAIDGEPNLGKTTVLRSIGRRYQRIMRERWGDETTSGDEYIPVCHITLPSAASIKDINREIANFFALVARVRESTTVLTDRIVEAMCRCGTSLVLIDDLHHLRPHALNGQALNDHLKNLMNKVPATFVFAGVGLLQAGIFSEGKGGEDKRYAQLASRLRRFEINLIDAYREPGQWVRLLKAIERDLRLLKPTRLSSKEISGYLFAHTQGSIGILMDLIQLAARESLERDSQHPLGARGITIDVFDATILSQRAEQLRPRRNVSSDPDRTPSKQRTAA
jgi:hypothetical protein